MEANNVSQNTKMNAHKNKMPSEGSSQPSNGTTDWRTVRFNTQGLHPAQAGKIKSCLATLQEGEKCSPEFKKALDHMWDHYYRLVAPDKESFCKHLGLSVPEAEGLLNRANQPASDTAPAESDSKHAPKIQPKWRTMGMLKLQITNLPPTCSNVGRKLPNALKVRSRAHQRKKRSVLPLRHWIILRHPGRWRQERK